MARFTSVGIAFVLAAVGLAVLVWAGRMDAVGASVFGSLLVVFSIPCFIIGRLGRGTDRDIARVQELRSRGVRLRGRVLDAVPYASAHGGAVLHSAGAQMVLSVALDRGAAGTEQVTLHVIESSEAARARIGTEVIVIEHPDEPAIRTLEGFLPNGIRA